MPCAPSPSSPCIDPRTTPVLCLPTGWRLLCQQGRVVVRSGPLLWGQVLHQQQRSLDCGEVMEGGHDGMPVWLQLRGLGTEPVRLQLLPPEAPTAQAFGLWAVLPGWLRRWRPARQGRALAAAH